MIPQCLDLESANVVRLKDQVTISYAERVLLLINNLWSTMEARMPRHSLVTGNDYVRSGFHSIFTIWKGPGEKNDFFSYWLWVLASCVLCVKEEQVRNMANKIKPEENPKSEYGELMSTIGVLRDLLSAFKVSNGSWENNEINEFRVKCFVRTVFICC